MTPAELLAQLKALAAAEVQTPEFAAFLSASIDALQAFAGSHIASPVLQSVEASVAASIKSALLAWITPAPPVAPVAQTLPQQPAPCL